MSNQRPDAFYRSFIRPGLYCEKGHEAISGKGTCLACSNRVTICGYNDLGCTQPELTKELQTDIDPHWIYEKTNLKFQWKCSNGHVWNAPVKVRTEGNGCRVCFNESSAKKQTISKKLSEFRDQIPFDLLDSSLWDSVSRSSHEMLTWVCDAGHHFDKMPNRIRAKSKCPVCQLRQLSIGDNDLFTLNPRLAKELADQNNGYLISNSKEIVEWHRQCNPEEIAHRWWATIESRNVHGTGCKVCAGTEFQAGVNDFETFLQKLSDAGEILHWSNENSVLPHELPKNSREIVAVECRNHSSPILIRRSANQFGQKNCVECKPNGEKFVSQAERDILELLSQNFSEISLETSVRRFRSEGVYEIDLLIAEKIALDFNGAYWHQEGVFKPIGFHAKKSAILERLGLIELAVEEEDWEQDRAATEQMILEFVGNFLLGELQQPRKGRVK